MDVKLTDKMLEQQRPTVAAALRLDQPLQAAERLEPLQFSDRLQPLNLCKNPERRTLDDKIIR